MFFIFFKFIYGFEGSITVVAAKKCIILYLDDDCGRMNLLFAIETSKTFDVLVSLHNLFELLRFRAERKKFFKKKKILPILKIEIYPRFILSSSSKIEFVKDFSLSFL